MVNEAIVASLAEEGGFKIYFLCITWKNFLSSNNLDSFLDGLLSMLLLIRHFREELLQNKQCSVCERNNTNEPLPKHAHTGASFHLAQTTAVRTSALCFLLIFDICWLWMSVKLAWHTKKQSGVDSRGLLFAYYRFVLACYQLPFAVNLACQMECFLKSPLKRLEKGRWHWMGALFWFFFQQQLPSHPRKWTLLFHICIVFRCFLGSFTLQFDDNKR